MSDRRFWMEEADEFFEDYPEPGYNKMTLLGGGRIWWCADWYLNLDLETEGYETYVKHVMPGPQLLRWACTAEAPHSDDCGWCWLVKE